MAVTVTDLVTLLVAANVRADIFLLAGKLGLQIRQAPGDPGYQLVDTLAHWFAYAWNTFGLPGIAAQFGDFASGPWLDLFWVGLIGLPRNEASFATGPVPFENRSGIYQDVSAVGAVSITVNGYTFVSSGPAPGYTGTMAGNASAPYAQTWLTMVCTVTGSLSNVAAGAIPGYPTTPASAPAGVYVATSSSSPTVNQAALIGSAGEMDPAYTSRGRATITSYAPLAVQQKYVGLALGAQLAPGVPVSTNRVRVIAFNATVNVYCAAPGGPSPAGDVTAISAAILLACTAPGLTINVSAAGLLTVNVGTITLYVRAESNVSTTTAIATANAALALWGGSILPVGGARKMTGGQGYVFADEVRFIAGCALATAPNPPSPFIAAPGIVKVDVGTGDSFADVMVSPSQVAVLTYTVTAVLVTQGA